MSKSGKQERNSRRVQAFRDKSRLRRQQALATGDLSLLGQPSEHYHILYNAVPYMGQGFETQGLGYRAIKKIADAHDPHVIYYEDGPVQLTHAKVKDRTGYYRIMIQLGSCRRLCQNITMLPSENKEN